MVEGTSGGLLHDDVTRQRYRRNLFPHDGVMLHLAMILERIRAPRLAGGAEHGSRLPPVHKVEVLSLPTSKSYQSANSSR